jgi:hypothetical protein
MYSHWYNTNLLSSGKSLFRFSAERPSRSLGWFILSFVGRSRQTSSTFWEDVSLLINLITLYLTAPSAPQAIWRMAGRLTNDEFERKWKEAVMASIRVLSRNPPGGTEENNKVRVSTVVPTRFEAGTSRSQLTARAYLLGEKNLLS